MTLQNGTYHMSDYSESDNRKLANQVLAEYGAPLLNPPKGEIDIERDLGIPLEKLEGLKPNQKTKLILARLDMIPDLPNKQREKFLKFVGRSLKGEPEPVDDDDDSPDDPVAKYAKKVTIKLDNDSPGKPDSVGEDLQSDPTIHISQLLAEPHEDIEYLVDGLLPTSGISLLTARPKVGKSTLARHLATQVSGDGGLWLDREIKQTGSVVLLCLEEKRAQIAKHLSDCGATSKNNLQIAFALESNNVECLESLINKHNAMLLIVDPLQRFAVVDDGNDYSQVNKVINPIVDVSRRTGCHIMLVHHARKMNDGQVGTSVLGSTAFAGAVDCLIEMSRSKKTGKRTCSSIQRYGTDLDEIIVDESGGSVGKVEDIKTAEYRDTILDVLNEQGKPVSNKELRDFCKTNSPVFTKALKELMQDGLVHRQGEGNKNSPYSYSTEQSDLFAYS